METNLFKKDKDLQYCETSIKGFYDRYQTFYNKYEKNIQPEPTSVDNDLPDNINDLSEEKKVDLEKQKKIVNDCIETYSRKFKRNIFKKNLNKEIIQLANPGGKVRPFFMITAQIAESSDIYNKITDMSISNSIKKVLTEQVEIKKQDLVEKKLINDRINFILENNNNQRTNLINEAKKLIDNGYNKNIVKEIVNKYLK
jgi:hypothetical protein